MVRCSSIANELLIWSRELSNNEISNCELRTKTSFKTLHQQKLKFPGTIA